MLCLIVFAYEPIFTLTQTIWTALMWSCYYGHAECARLLLESGADPNLKADVNLFLISYYYYYYYYYLLNTILLLTAVIVVASHEQPDVGGGPRPFERGEGAHRERRARQLLRQGVRCEAFEGHTLIKSALALLLS